MCIRDRNNPLNGPFCFGINEMLTERSVFRVIFIRSQWFFKRIAFKTKRTGGGRPPIRNVLDINVTDYDMCLRL